MDSSQIEWTVRPSLSPDRFCVEARINFSEGHFRLIPGTVRSPFAFEGCLQLQEHLIS